MYSDGFQKTNVYSIETIKREEVIITLKEVYDALKERGYKPINQLVGYLMSGDLAYISSYKDARKKIAVISREDIIETLLKRELEK
jgi:UPF0297 protein bcer98_3100